MSNIISLSGGKDSTAMLLMMIEKKIKIDHIVFFDTGWDFPEMIEHIDKLEKYIDKKIIRLKPKRDFYEMLPKWGIPVRVNRWCTREKVRTIYKYINQYKPNTQWIGFSYNEAKRIKKTIGYCYPLVDWKVTEEDALKYCFDKGFDWGGLYKKHIRVNCWLCPFQRISDLKTLWMDYPEYWKKLIEIQRHSKYPFRMDYTLEELDERFTREENYHQMEI